MEGIDKCGRGSVAALGTELTPPVTDATQPSYTQILNSTPYKSTIYKAQGF